MPRTGTKLAIALALLATSARAAGTRIKDITTFEGARDNQLTGVGLVVGLENTGGRSLLTQQMAVDMLQRFRVNSLINSNSNLAPVYRAFSASVVAVTTEIGPYTRRGSKVDVLVSVMDDALSLQGGTLIFTPLRGADDVVYAVAQGPLSIGGFQFTVPAGTSTPLASAQKNHPTVGRIPGGAIVERESRGDIVCNGTVRLLLRVPDFTTACAIARVINGRFPRSAVPLDAGTVQVFVPRERLNDIVCWAGEVGQLEVTPMRGRGRMAVVPRIGRPPDGPLYVNGFGYSDTGELETVTAVFVAERHRAAPGAAGVLRQGLHADVSQSPSATKTAVTVSSSPVSE